MVQLPNENSEKDRRIKELEEENKELRENLAKDVAQTLVDEHLRKINPYPVVEIKRKVML